MAFALVQQSFLVFLLIIAYLLPCWPCAAAALPTQKDKSCPFTIKSADMNATSYSFEWPIPKNMPKAAWYASVMVQCMNGTKPAFCQYDTTKNQTYWGTTVINGTPTGMIVATAVCSALGPLFLASYFIKDTLTRRKK